MSNDQSIPQLKPLITYVSWNFFSRITHLYPEYECIPLSKAIFRKNEISALVGFKGGGAFLAKLLGFKFWNIHEGLYHISGQKPCSFMLEREGNYLDARKASEWESWVHAIPTLMNSSSPKRHETVNEIEQTKNDNFIEDILQIIVNAFPILAPCNTAQANELLTSMLSHRLSSDKFAPDAPPYHLYTPGGRKRVVILDEEHKNTSALKKSLATEKSYINMLDKAKQENPGAAFFLLEPRSVRNEKKQGYLRKYAQNNDVHVLQKNVSSISILSQADKVYTVASPLGIDAILLGKNIHCFGVPYYAGWGLTTDHVKTDRRNISRTRTEIFTALCLFFSRYRHPITNDASSFQEMLRFITLQRPLPMEVDKYIACINFTSKQQSLARKFFSHAELHFMPIKQAVIETKKHKGMIFSRTEPDDEMRKTCAGLPLVFVQRGVLDRLLEQEDAVSWCLEGGPYPTLERILQTVKPKENELLRARLFRQYLREISAFRPHYDLYSVKKGKKIVLLIGNADLTPNHVYQKTDDNFTSGSANVDSKGSPVHSFSSPLFNDATLIEHVRKQNPDAHIIYCPQAKEIKLPDSIEALVDSTKPFARPSDFLPLSILGINESYPNSDQEDCDDTSLECLPSIDDVKSHAWTTERVNALRFLEKAQNMTSASGHSCPLFLPIHDVDGHPIEVHSFDSFLGLEALALCMDVFTYGWPIYAGWGLTKDTALFPKRTRPLSIDTLLTGALIIQPRYFDRRNNIFCEPENTPYLLIRDKQVKTQE